MDDILYAILVGLVIGLFFVYIIYRIGTAIQEHNNKKYLEWLKKTDMDTIDTVDANEAKQKRIDELYKKIQHQLDQYSKQKQVPEH